MQLRTSVYSRRSHAASDFDDSNVPDTAMPLGYQLCQVRTEWPVLANTSVATLVSTGDLIHRKGLRTILGKTASKSDIQKPEMIEIVHLQLCP